MPSDVAIIWDQLGPYHMDRCDALATRLQGEARVHGIEIASRSEAYAWSEAGGSNRFLKHTIYRGRRFEETRALSRFARVLVLCVRLSATHVFLTNYSYPDTCLLAFSLRLLGKRVYFMCVSKFDDLPRVVWKEFLKSFLLLPYRGALAAGPRSASYLRFLGFRRRVVEGTNTLSLERMLECGGGLAAPEGEPFVARHFVLVGRFVPKKDIATAIAAYARYRELAKATPRAFHICGAGPLEGEIRGQIAVLELDGVVLHGFLQRDGIAGVLAGGLALIVPSVEEQWGLVVNEALAFCLPVLATDQVGARDLLIRTGVNGYMFEPGNVEGLARLMVRIADDQDEWLRLVEGSRTLRDRADVERFADAVISLVDES